MEQKVFVDEHGIITPLNNSPQIYSLIGQAMRKIGAIGKDSVNTQQKYKFRGIDAVYNALNPVMSELGLFICPEILEHRREERETQNVYNGEVKKTILKYSILTIKYTIYAPDGSNVSCVVVGEGMDSGDKASNKAMSVALKYACFQLFMIPTEEMIDPDAETHEVTSRAIAPAAPKQVKQEAIKQDAPATVEKVSAIPADPAPMNPVLKYLSTERENLRIARKISAEENTSIWNKQISVLRESGKISKKALSAYTKKEAEELVNFMYTLFTEKGTELMNVDGQTS